MLILNVVFSICTWISSLIFLFIAIYAFKSKNPINLWAGTTVSKEELKDVKKYNIANGYMWLGYTLCMILAGVISLFNTIVGVILFLIICILGIFIIIYIYSLIYKKYANPDYKRIVNKQNVNMKKILIPIIAIFVIIITGVILFSIKAEKDPEVILSKDLIEIKSIYGINIKTSDIVEVKLIEAKASQIDFGRRVNGYNGFGKALKGRFKSNSMGESLVFVQEDLSPVIRISRKDGIPIYFNFKNPDKTYAYYNDILSIVPDDSF